MVGFINILKNPGYTSSDVVNIVKGILSKHFNQKIKVGHLGTLDPGASGVLPIAISNATKYFDLFNNKKKLYRTCFIFNKTSETLDSYSEIISSDKEVEITKENLTKALKELQGDIMQIPPKYSAVHVNGQRAYKIARSGEEVNIKPRKITIYEYTNIEIKKDRVYMDILCSTGTYIRSIVRDLASILNTVGYMAYLIRLDVEPNFSIENAVTISELALNVEQNIMNVDDVFVLNKIFLNSCSKELENGIPVNTSKEDGLYYVYINNKLFSLAKVNNKVLKSIIRLDR